MSELDCSFNWLSFFFYTISIATMNKLQYFTLLILVGILPSLSAQTINSGIDYEKFLSNHEMVWSMVPDNWQLSPFSGNGNVGFLFYQTEGEAKNTMSLHVGRHDYYDHREAPKEKQLIWIYRGRLPLGHFNFTSKGNITGIDMRLSLWNAELTGTVFTSEGSYNIRGLTHSDNDVVFFETDANEGESIQITWHPDDPVSSVWETLQAGGGPRKGGMWQEMINDPMPMPEKYTLSEQNGINFCYQPLYQNRGETTTSWKTKGSTSGKQELLVSVHHSYPEKNSMDIVADNINNAEQALAENMFIDSHRKWWHEYYPLSFLTIDDTEKEAFYWIQIYKFASASREDGPIMDLMGPWYNRTFWPMVWGDLNVQLQYWTHLAANRLSVGESLPNNIDKYAENLEGNVPDHWINSAAVGALFPQDMDSYNGGKVPDMLTWILHDYWLHCQFAGDKERIKTKLYPILKKAFNSYLNYFEENTLTDEDGTIHIKRSWSPEYKPGRGQDINFTIALIKWSSETLLNINKEHELNDPLAPKWKHVSDNLVDFQIDENGLRIGKHIAFNKPHRHYSHLLGFYPLSVISPDTEENRKLIRSSLDHWLDVTINSTIEIKAMPVTGYTATGASSMYATLGDKEKALYYLKFFINHKNVSPTTMYSEGKSNPVIESPLSFATCVHDMLIQSNNGKIIIFPGTPDEWSNAAFHQLRTQGAFLVSAKKEKAKTQFVIVESLVGSSLVINPDIENPNLYIEGKKVSKRKLGERDENGFYSFDLKKGECAILSVLPLKKTDLTIRPIAVKEKDKNLFGYSEKTARLSGHKYYSAQ